MPGTITITANGTQGVIKLNGDPGAAPAVSSANQAWIYYSQTSNKLFLSLNGGSYTELATNSFVQNGNAFGTTAVFGTTDANPIYFVINNINRASLLNSGNFGIGTTSPQRLFHINATTTSSTAVARYQNAAGTSDLYISAGTPEGSITANIGDRCIDTTNGIQYTKRTQSGSSSGWIATMLYNVTSKNAGYTVTNSDGLILVDTSGGPVTITLPTATVAGTGTNFVIKKITGDANNVIVTSSGGTNIDGSGSRNITVQYETMQVVADSTRSMYWRIV